jgi:hypothetical protein
MGDPSDEMKQCPESLQNSGISVCFLTFSFPHRSRDAWMDSSHWKRRGSGTSWRGKTRQNHELTRQNHELTRQNHELTRHKHELTRHKHELTRHKHELTRHKHELTRHKHEFECVKLPILIFICMWTQEKQKLKKKKTSRREDIPLFKPFMRKSMQRWRRECKWLVSMRILWALVLWSSKMCSNGAGTRKKLSNTLRISKIYDEMNGKFRKTQSKPWSEHFSFWLWRDLAHSKEKKEQEQTKNKYTDNSFI